MYKVNKVVVSMSSKNTIDYRHRVKAAIVKAFGNSCYICGRTFSPKIYELHHINPRLKEFHVSHSTHSIPSVINECKKCILVCPTCHRLITLEEVMVPITLKSNFNSEVFVKEYDRLKPIKSKLPQVLTKEKLINHLKSGNSLTQIGNIYHIKMQTVSKYCALYNINPSDYKTTLNKVLDRVTLKKLIRTKSFVSIGKQYGVTDNAIRKLCKKYNLPYKKTVINSINEFDWNEI